MTEYQRSLKESPSKKEIHRKWKTIAQELSDLNLSLTDLDEEISTNPQLAQLVGLKNHITMGDMVLLKQYTKAINTGDTRAAEFLRDTMGENPKQTVEIQKSTLSQMSDAELEDALQKLKNLTTEGDNNSTDEN